MFCPMCKQLMNHCETTESINGQYKLIFTCENNCRVDFIHIYMIANLPIIKQRGDKE